MQDIVKQDKVEDTIQEPYSNNKAKELYSKSLHQVIGTTFYHWRLADIIECLEYTSLAYTQHYLGNSENNNHSRCSFLPDVNLFNASPHTTIYPGIRTDFISEDTTL